jgi:hypothetical protein
MGPVFVRRRPLMRLAAGAAGRGAGAGRELPRTPGALVERASAYRAQTESTPRYLPDPPTWGATPGPVAAGGPAAGARTPGASRPGRASCRAIRPTS